MIINNKNILNKKRNINKKILVKNIQKIHI